MNVIFVCTGNTCRSPMAEGYLKSLNIPDLEISSRGLCADGSPVSDNSREVMQEIGIDISSHHSEQFTAEDLKADLIICLSDSHKYALISAGADESRLKVLGSGIPDPYGYGTDIYRECRNSIIKAADSLVFSGCFTPFTIEELKKNDIPQIAEIEKECFSEPWSENAVLEAYNAGNKFFVARSGDKISGYVSISTVLDEAYFNNIAVTASCRCKGAAKLLMHRLDVYARENRLSFISLEVRAGNIPAQSLYSKSGYKKEGLRKNFYRNPDEDAIILTKRFEYNENIKY